MKWKNFAEMEIFFNNKILIKYKHVLTKRTHEKKKTKQNKTKKPCKLHQKMKTNQSKFMGGANFFSAVHM